LEFTEYLQEIAAYPGKIDPLLLPMIDIDISWLDKEYGTKFNKKTFVY
jgi:hypothetical protein